MELEIHLKERKERLIISCDRYETKEVEEGDFAYRRLILYRGDREVGHYDADSIIGFHELPPRSGPIIA